MIISEKKIMIAAKMRGNAADPSGSKRGGGRSDAPTRRITAAKNANIASAKSAIMRRIVSLIANLHMPNDWRDLMARHAII
jgi:hypothetical protein